MENTFGVVLFDDPVTHDSGWACQWEEGGARPSRISGTGELTSDAVWMTNLSYEDAKISGLNGSRFRRSKYLYHDLARLWGEVGLSADNPLISPSEVWGGRYPNAQSLRAAYTAWLFRQVTLTMNHVVPMLSPPATDIVYGLHDKIIPASSRYFIRGVPKNDVLDACSMADSAWTPVAREGKPDKSARSVRLFPNRVIHAISMLSEKWPISSRWVAASQQDMIDPVSWIERNPYSLLRVTVTRTPDREMERLINFGANIDGKRGERYGRWVTGIDMLRIMPFCELKIVKAFSAQEGISGLEMLNRAGIDLRFEDVIYRSGAYSFGLFMDALWRVMLKAPFDFKERDTRIPATTFLHAKDRQLLFNPAVRLSKLGYNVTGYGSGGITLDLDNQTDMKELAQHAVMCGLFPPFTQRGVFTPEEAMSIAMNNERHALPEAGRRLEAAMLAGDLDSIIMLDEALSCWDAE